MDNLEDTDDEDEEIQNDEPLRQIKEHQKVHSDIEIDSFLASLDQPNCFRKSSKNKMGRKEFLELTFCLSKLENYLFKPIMDPLGTAYIQSNRLNKLLYLPLASNSSPSSSFAENLIYLLYNNKQQDILEKLDHNIDSKEFQDDIMQTFSKGLAKLNQKDWSYQVSDLWTEILKDFHVYWNTLRYNQQMSQLSKHTKDTLRQILNQYAQKENLNYEITKTLVSKIKQGYQRFIMAHQAMEQIENNGFIILKEQILKLYEEFLYIDPKKSKDYNKDFNLILTQILDLNLCLMLVYYTQQQRPKKNLKDLIEDDIIKGIEEIYQRVEMEKKLVDNQKQQIQHFTVIVLLKIKHQIFIYFKYHSEEQLEHFSDAFIQPPKSLSVKLYHQMLDNFTGLIPRCVDALNLKNCIYVETKKIFSFLDNKYQLNSSYVGQHLHFYLQRLFQFMLKDFRSADFDNISKFKDYFYPRLFKSLFNFKIRFKIKDDNAFDQLEKEIGILIEQYKLNIDGDLADIKYKVLDQLDLDIYTKFLDLKGQLDEFSPILNDKLAILEVDKQMKNFLKIFEESYQKDIDVGFEKLIEKILMRIDRWTGLSLQRLGKIKTAELNKDILKASPDLFKFSKYMKFYENNYSKNHLMLGDHETIDDEQPQENEEGKTEIDNQQTTTKEGSSENEKQSVQPKENNEKADQESDSEDDHASYLDKKIKLSELLDKNDEQQKKDKKKVDILRKFLLTKVSQQRPAKKNQFGHLKFNDIYDSLADTTQGYEKVPSYVQNSDKFDEPTEQNHTVILNNINLENGISEGLHAQKTHFDTSTEHLHRKLANSSEKTAEKPSK